MLLGSILSSSIRTNSVHDRLIHLSVCIPVAKIQMALWDVQVSNFLLTLWNHGCILLHGVSRDGDVITRSSAWDVDGSASLIWYSVQMRLIVPSSVRTNIVQIELIAFGLQPR